MTAPQLVLLVTLMLGPLAAPPVARAQQPGTLPRIGFLWYGSPAPGQLNTLQAAFLDQLRTLGYVNGRNITIEDRWAEAQPDRLRDLAAEFVRLGVNVIVTDGGRASLAAREATASIPIVVAVAADLVGIGLVATPARPGGNVTGSDIISPDLAGKRLELLREVVPGVKRVGVLWNPNESGKALEWRATQVAARMLGLQVRSLEVRSPDDFAGAFGALTRERPGALIAFGDPLTNAHRKLIADFALANRLPAMYELRGFVQDGGLIAYGPSLHEIFRRAALYVDKILKGAKPADLPVEQPTKFDLVINLKTAKALGLTIPQSVLIRADEILQ